MTYDPEKILEKKDKEIERLHAMILRQHRLFEGLEIELRKVADACAQIQDPARLAGPSGDEDMARRILGYPPRK